MQEVANFRRHYNDYLYGSLRELELERKSLLFLFGISALIFTLIVIAIFILKIPALTLFIWLPVVFWTTVVGWRVRKYKQNFKPRIIPVILQYINPSFKYYSGEFIPLDTFMRSSIFGFKPEMYKGEDYIKGVVGAVDFEMCELVVKHPSPVKAELENIFNGIFFHALLIGNFKGRLLILPIEDRQRHTRTIRDITKTGGSFQKGLGEEFDKYFICYAEANIDPHNLLTEDMMQAFLEYRKKYDKKMYFSFIDNHFFAAIEEPYDLLEPHIFVSNNNFDLMFEYYQDLTVITGLVETFDLSH